MEFDALSADDKAAVLALVKLLRTVAMEFAKLGNHGRAVANGWAGNVESIVNTLAAEAVIPIPPDGPGATGLAGAQPLTKAQLTTLVGYAIDFSATTDNAAGSYNTNFHRGLYARAAGAVNTIG